MQPTPFRLSSPRPGATRTARGRWLAFGLAGALALPLAAQAQQAPAYTNGPAIMRAGPSQDYPEVARVQPGVPVNVVGCLPGYSWCDVALPGMRGWVHAGRLNYPYRGSSVPLANYGTVIGVPIVSFAIGPYWDEFYRGRPWFHDRDRWAHRGPPSFAGGPGWGGPPPGYGRERDGFHGRPPGPGEPFHGAGAPPFHGGGEPFRGGGEPFRGGGEPFHGGGPGGERGRDGGPHGGPGGDDHRGGGDRGGDHGHGGPG